MKSDELRDALRAFAASSQQQSTLKPLPIPEQLSSPGDPFRNLVRSSYVGHLMDCDPAALTAEHRALIREDIVSVLKGM